MAIPSLLEANRLLLSRRRWNFQGHLCGIKSSQLAASSSKVWPIQAPLKKCANNNNNTKLRTPAAMKMSDCSLGLDGDGHLRQYESSQIIAAPKPVDSRSAAFGYDFILLSIVMVCQCVNMIFDTHLNLFNKQSEEATPNSTSILVNPPCTFIKFQVAFSHLEASLRKDLKRILKTADTSTSCGRTFMLMEVAEFLLYRSIHWNVEKSSVKVRDSKQDAAEEFKKLFIEEREEFYSEYRLLINPSRRINPVVTILVAAQCEGEVDFGTSFMNKEILDKALKQLQSIHSSGEIHDVKILWSPEYLGYIPTREELREDYPFLMF